MRPAAARRPRRSRSQPFGVHDRGTRARARWPTRLEAWPREVAARVSIVEHEGVHPRLGSARRRAVRRAHRRHRARRRDAAREFARWWSTSFAVPVFFYDEADPQRRSLPATRGDAFRRRAPDLGPAQPHPDARRDGGRCARAARRDQLPARHRRRGASRARGAGGARTRRRAARRARARLLPQPRPAAPRSR